MQRDFASTITSSSPIHDPFEPHRDPRPGRTPPNCARVNALRDGSRSRSPDWAAECPEAPQEAASLSWRTSTTTAPRPPTGSPTCPNAAASSSSSGPTTSLPPPERRTAVTPTGAGSSLERSRHIPATRPLSPRFRVPSRRQITDYLRHATDDGNEEEIATVSRASSGPTATLGSSAFGWEGAVAAWMPDWNGSPSNLVAAQTTASTGYLICARWWGEACTRKTVAIAQRLESALGPMRKTAERYLASTGDTPASRVIQCLRALNACALRREAG